MECLHFFKEHYKYIRWLAGVASEDDGVSQHDKRHHEVESNAVDCVEEEFASIAAERGEGKHSKEEQFASIATKCGQRETK